MRRHIHIHTHTYPYIHTHTHTYTYTYPYPYIHIRIHIQTHTYYQTIICLSHNPYGVHLHTHIHIHTYTYTYTYTYTHTPTRCYQTGLLVPQDDSSAFKWLLRGAKLGHVTCQLMAGKWLNTGKGCSYSRKHAIRCWTQAMRQGDGRVTVLLKAEKKKYELYVHALKLMYGLNEVEIDVEKAADLLLSQEVGRERVCVWERVRVWERECFVCERECVCEKRERVRM